MLIQVLQLSQNEIFVVFNIVTKNEGILNARTVCIGNNQQSARAISFYIRYPRT